MTPLYGRVGPCAVPVTRTRYGAHMTFILHVSVAADGRVRGMLTNAQTGEKERFEGTDALGVLVQRMATQPGAGGVAMDLAALE